MAGAAQVACPSLTGCCHCTNAPTRRCLMEILRRRALASSQVRLQSREEAEASLAAKVPAMSWPELAVVGLTSSSPVKSFGPSSRRRESSGFVLSMRRTKGRRGIHLRRREAAGSTLAAVPGAIAAAAAVAAFSRVFPAAGARRLVRDGCEEVSEEMGGSRSR